MTVRSHSLVMPRLSFFPYAIITSLLVVLLSCNGGGGGNPNFKAPTNIGGGYTFVVSGGTLNDGAASNGLVILATLRDSSGKGPSAEGWKITIGGPGINTPLAVTYDDGSSSSYMAWWWSGFNPQAGTYAATAVNGDTILICTFTIDASKILSMPILQKTANAITITPLEGAGSYYYTVRDGFGTLVDSGYIDANSGPAYQFALNVPNGSYHVEVVAQTTNRVALQNDVSASPSLALQENLSVSSLDFVAGGMGNDYALNAVGGTLYMGADSGVDSYGLVIWTSLATLTTPSTPPAGYWDITVTGPGLSKPLAFTYPAHFSSHLYWDYDTIPKSGSYTVTAALGDISLSKTFTIQNVTAQLPVATGITVIPETDGGATVSWSPVAGAKSYYVNLWTCDGGVNTPTGCNGGNYSEIAGLLVNSSSVVFPPGTLSQDLNYDVYITASSVDMTIMSSFPSQDPGLQVDMSDNTFLPVMFTAI